MKPILFNTEMVRAILDGRKTCTRRVIKNKDIINEWDCDADGTPIAYIDQATGDSYSPTAAAPYHPGDILWVRETFFREECTPDCAGQSDQNECPFNRVGNSCYGYKTQYIDSTGKIKWRPSIHMPREAARLFLRVTDVRAERLRDIRDDGCKAEGIVGWSKDGNLYKCAPADDEGDYPCWEWSGCPRTPQEAMQRLWDGTLTKDKLPLYGWDANPWVWVIKFERISRETALSGKTAE